jgi:hypothetical protein
MTNIDELKSTGLKATVPRLKILEIFQKGTQRHMTAEDVFRVLLDDRSDVGLATVYRVLAQFEQADILTTLKLKKDKLQWPRLKASPSPTTPSVSTLIALRPNVRTARYRRVTRA